MLGECAGNLHCSEYNPAHAHQGSPDRCDRRGSRPRTQGRHPNSSRASQCKYQSPAQNREPLDAISFLWALQFYDVTLQPLVAVLRLERFSGGASQNQYLCVRHASSWVKATDAPSLASRCTIAAPMPHEPLVTRATLPGRA